MRKLCLEKYRLYRHYILHAVSVRHCLKAFLCCMAYIKKRSEREREERCDWLLQEVCYVIANVNSFSLVWNINIKPLFSC